jgi:hypothetical protein
MGLLTKIFRYIDNFTFSIIKFSTYKFIKDYNYINNLFIIGGGPSRVLLEQSSGDKKNSAYASLNYTHVPSNIKIDFLLLSDHFIFKLLNLKKTLMHINRINPDVIILPTRALYSLLGLILLLKKRVVFVKYYGEPLWEKDTVVHAYNLYDEIPSYDTVAYEFGFPLAHSLLAENLIFAGVDLSYGPIEDYTPFRVQWRDNIEKSIRLVDNIYDFHVYKICKSSFGPFEVYNEHL